MSQSPAFEPGYSAILDMPLTPEVSATFDTMADAFNQAAGDWEQMVRDTHLVSEQTSAFASFIESGGVRAYDAHFSLVLGLVEQGAPAEILSTTEGKQYVLYADPAVSRRISDELCAPDRIGNTVINPAHALARAIERGHIYLPEDNFALRNTTAGADAKVAHQWAREQGLLPSAILTSILANARTAWTMHPPKDREKIMFSLLATMRDASGRLAKPMSPEAFHQLATRNLPAIK